MFDAKEGRDAAERYVERCWHHGLGDWAPITEVKLPMAKGVLTKVIAKAFNRGNAATIDSRQLKGPPPIQRQASCRAESTAPGARPQPGQPNTASSPQQVESPGSECDPFDEESEMLREWEAGPTPPC